MIETNLIGDLLLKLVVILASAKIMGQLSERLGQPAVIGEILTGIILGPTLFNYITNSSEVIKFLAEIGIIMLLFKVGLESKAYKLIEAGIDSALVAIIGVVLPFMLGYLYFSYLKYPPMTSMLIGAALTATSVGITSRVLSDMGKIATKEGEIVLGAAVIDDVLGLIILSTLVGIAEHGSFSFINIGKIVIISLIFLVGTIYIGIRFSPFLFKLVHKLQTRRTFIITAFILAVFMAYISHVIGLATVIGAFAAGLMLEKIDFKEKIEKRIKAVSDLFVPIFFVLAGVAIDIKSLFQFDLLSIIVILTIIAIIGKLLAGLGGIKQKVSKIAIGVGMLPRGEVGLIFATFGLSYGLITSGLYSALIIVIMLTTIIAPSLLKSTFAKIEAPHS